MSSDADILYIGFLLGHGGDAVQMMELAAGMAARGRRVKLVVPELETSVAFADVCRARGLPVERSPWIHSDAWAAKQHLPSLFRFFRRHRAPVLHLHTGDVCLPRSVLFVMRLLRLPRAFATIQSPYNTLTPGTRRARHWAALAPRTFHSVVCPSEHSRRAQIACGLPESAVRTVHNSVDLDRYGRGDRDAPRRALGLPPDAPLVVFSSRMDAQKRPLDALEAFRRAAPARPDAHLVFVGRGAQEGEARAAAAQAGLQHRVHFAGFQTNVEDWLAAADAWILPTESENFSLAVLEALAAGCAVVSTWCQGNDEVLEPDRNALVTPVGDAAAMGDALARLLGDPALRARLGGAARRTAQSYSADAMAAQYARAYAEADARFGELQPAPGAAPLL